MYRGEAPHHSADSVDCLPLLWPFLQPCFDGCKIDYCTRQKGSLFYFSPFLQQCSDGAASEIVDKLDDVIVIFSHGAALGLIAKHVLTEYLCVSKCEERTGRVLQQNTQHNKAPSGRVLQHKRQHNTAPLTVSGMKNESSCCSSNSICCAEGGWMLSCCTKNGSVATPVLGCCRVCVCERRR
jgi:hypothetical protein